MRSKQYSVFKLVAPKKPPLEIRGERRATERVKADEIALKDLLACSTPEARRCLAYETAEKLQVLPLGLMRMFDGELLTIAAQRSDDPELISALRFATGKTVRLIAVKTTALSQAIFAAYHGDGRQLENIVSGLKGQCRREGALGLSPAKVLDFRSGNSQAVKLLVSLVDFAMAHNASDLHLWPRPEGCFVKMRINGELLLHEESLGGLGLHNQLITRLKVLCNLDTSQHVLPQDGSFKTAAGGREVQVRVSIMPTVHGEKAVLRFSSCEGLITLADLGCDERTYNALRDFMDGKEGAALFAGPTGSGKSTTMYAIMHELSDGNLSLVSIEDPIEMQLKGVAQTSVNDKVGLNYAACLRAVLRQDPDVILLGEVRDEESARIAFQAALTGHLLLSTVHARSVFEVFMRLEHLGVDSLLMGQTINLVVCQRLLPKLCEHCRVFDLEGSNLMGRELFKPVGCNACEYSGFSGRVLALESLSVDETVSRWLRTGKHDYLGLHSLCNARNYSSFRGSLLTLLKEGKISLKQVREVSGLGDEAITVTS